MLRRPDPGTAKCILEQPASTQELPSSSRADGRVPWSGGIEGVVVNSVTMLSWSLGATSSAGAPLTSLGRVASSLVWVSLAIEPADR